MEQVKAGGFSRAEWVFLAIVAVVLGCILIGKQIALKKYAVNYQHSLAYPQSQGKILIQVGSLDRG